MNWRTESLAKHNDLITKRFVILFKQVLRLRERQIQKWNNGRYHHRVNKLIEDKLVELQQEAESINLPWFPVLVELEKQGFRKLKNEVL